MGLEHKSFLGRIAASCSMVTFVPFRIAERWTQIYQRFEKYDMPSEKDLEIILEVLDLRLLIEGSSGDVIQEAGPEWGTKIRMSNDAPLKL